MQREYPELFFWSITAFVFIGILLLATPGVPVFTALLLPTVVAVPVLLIFVLGNRSAARMEQKSAAPEIVSGEAEAVEAPPPDSSGHTDDDSSPQPAERKNLSTQRLTSVVWKG